MKRNRKGRSKERDRKEPKETETKEKGHSVEIMRLKNKPETETDERERNQRPKEEVKQARGVDDDSRTERQKREKVGDRVEIKEKTETRGRRIIKTEDGRDAFRYIRLYPIFKQRKKSDIIVKRR